MASSRNSRSTEDLHRSVRERLAELIPPGRRIAVAFSGGLDSTVLLHIAADHAAATHSPISAIHIHHGLSQHANAWASHCEALCASLAVPITVVRVSVPRDAPEGLEAAARTLRYAAFAELGADHVLLGHHANDQAETLILNLMRGAGVRGAAGMQSVRGPDNRYVRPMLSCTRAELEAYANAHGLRWVEDDSNSDQSYARNFVRQEVLPVLTSRFPAAVENLARSVEYFAESQDMLDELARHDLGDAPATFPVSVQLLKGLSEARARNLLRYLLAEADLQAPASKKLAEVLRQFIEAGPDRHPSLDLPAYRLYRAKGEVRLELP